MAIAKISYKYKDDIVTTKLDIWNIYHRVRQTVMHTKEEEIKQMINSIHRLEE